MDFDMIKIEDEVLPGSKAKEVQSNTENKEVESELRRLLTRKECNSSSAECFMRKIVNPTNSTTKSVLPQKPSKNSRKNRSRLPNRKISSNKTRHCVSKVADSSHSSTVDFDEEWVSAKHYFGLNHCSRTYGSMIDYTSCNKSLIRFNKLQRMLMCQNKNNKRFQTCLYIRIDNSVSQQDEFIDILSNDDVGDGDGSEAAYNKSSTIETVEEREGRVRKSISTDPLKVIRLKVSENMNTFGLAVIKNMRNHQYDYQFHFVNSELLQKLAYTSKWIIIKLHKDVSEIIVNQSFKLPARTLFTLIFRADLNKKIICHTIGEAKNDDSIGLGVYGIPGLCDALILGPCSAARSYYSLQATIQCTSGGFETVDIPFVRSGSKTLSTNFATAVWWRPVNPLFSVTDINAAYISFLFNGRATTSRSKQAGKWKLRISKIIREPNIKSITCSLRTDGKDVNYLLTYRDELSSSVETSSRPLTANISSVLEEQPTTSRDVANEEGPRLPNTESICVKIPYLGNETAKRRSLLKKTKVKARKQGIRRNWVFLKPSSIFRIEKAFIMKILTEKRVDLFKEKIAIIRRYCEYSLRNKSLTEGMSA